MVGRRENFGEIVAKIGKARPPIDLKMFLSHTISYPIIPYVHGLGLLLLSFLFANPTAVELLTSRGLGG